MVHGGAAHGPGAPEDGNDNPSRAHNILSRSDLEAYDGGGTAVKVE